MSGGVRGRTRILANLLIIAGVVTLLIIAGCHGEQQIEEEALRSQLRASPAATTAEIVQNPTSVPSTPTSVSPTHPAVANTPTPEVAVATAAPVTPAASGGVSVPAQAAAPGGPPVRIVFPDLKIDAPVEEMGWQVVQTAQGPESEWNIPEDAAGHHINSADLGESGNIVLSAHNNIYGKIFGPISWAWDNDGIEQIDAATDRSHILDGRTVQLFNEAGQEYDFTVTSFYRIRDTGVSVSQRLENARFMEPTDSSQLTLITCWPPSSNTHRLVVIAEPVSR